MTFPGRLARVAVVVLLVTCVDGPTGPGSHAPATVHLRVTLPANTPAAWAPSGETLHVALRRAGRVDPIVDTSLVVGDSLAATLTVPLAYAVERFVVLGEARYDGLVLFIGFEAVQLRAAGDTTITVAATYVGPGARAATYALEARDSTLGQGDTASLLPVVRDSAGQLIPNVPARYVAARPNVVTVAPNGLLTGQPNAPDTARVTGYLPMGFSSSLLVQLVGVVQQVESVTVSPRTLTVALGAAPTFTATAHGATGVLAGQVYLWGSSDTLVARVNQAGVATTVGTGVTTITATTSGVAGSATLTVTTPAGGVTRTWLGNTAAWSDANNWDPTGVPAPADTVEIQATGNDPVLDANVTVSQVRVLGGNLRLNGHALTVVGDFSTEDGAGTLTMTQPGDTLRVQGKALFQGGATDGLLTDGVLLIAGDFEQRNSGSNTNSFRGSANHRTVLNGSVQQRFLPEGDATFGHLEIANTSGGIDGVLEQTVEIEGTLRFTTPAVFDGGDVALEVEDSLVMVAGSRLTTARVRLSGGMAVAGTFNPNTVEFAGDGQAIQPGLGYQNVEVTGLAHLVGTTVFAGYLVIQDNGNLTLNGQTLTAPTLNVGAGTNGGALTMQNPADVLVVEGDVSLDGDTTAGLLTNGVLRIGGNLSVGSGSFRKVLRASGNHRVVWIGSGLQNFTISARNVTFGHFEIANSGGIEVTEVGESVEFAVTGKLRITTPVALDGHDDAGRHVVIDVGDSLVTVAGSAMNLLDLTLRGGISLGGGLVADRVEFAGTNQPIPAAVEYHSITVSGTARLTGTTDASGVVVVRGPVANLAFGGHELVVGGSFTIGGAGFPVGSITMTAAADSLIVAHEMTFYGASTTGLLTAGTVIVGGGFFQGETSTSFAPSGTHRVVLNGAAQQVVDFQSPGAGASAFNHLDLANTAGGVFLQSPVRVAGQLRATGPSQLVASSAGRLLSAESVDVTRLTLDSVTLAIGSGAITRFDSVTFQRQDRSAIQLAIAHPGAAAPFTFTGLRFNSTPTSGLYISATDVTPADGNILTINLASSFPADGSAQTATVGGAIVNWTGGGAGFRGVLRAGLSFSCGADYANVAYCWGVNGSGQLGDGTTSNRAVPAAVTGLNFGLPAPGGAHACAARSQDPYELYCWGSNTYGQLGDGTTTDRLTPVLVVAGGLVFTQYSAGDQFSCGIANYQVYCWGRNGFGQLGDGTTTDRHTPTPVVLPGGEFVHLSAGANHVCARTAFQELYCWGSNSNGQLGDGTTTNRSTPVAVAGGHLFNMVSAGSEHTCGVVTDSAGQPAYCWGWNPYGQVGDGTTTSRTVPTAVTGGHQFALVSAGGNGFTCGLLTSYAAAYCWGINNVGQLGNGTTTASLAPVMVSGGLTLNYLVAGFAHVVAITDQSMGYAWGANNQGQLGDGTTTQRTAPVIILAPTP